MRDFYTQFVPYHRYLGRQLDDMRAALCDQEEPRVRALNTHTQDFGDYPWEEQDGQTAFRQAA